MIYTETRYGFVVQNQLSERLTMQRLNIQYLMGSMEHHQRMAKYYLDEIVKLQTECKHSVKEFNPNESTKCAICGKYM